LNFSWNFLGFFRGKNGKNSDYYLGFRNSFVYKDCIILTCNK
jgi:hypothetical protein